MFLAFFAGIPEPCRSVIAPFCSASLVSGCMGSSAPVDEVVAKLKSEGLPDLEELQFFFDSEDHVGRWVSKLVLGDATLLQTARVRRAWSAVRLCFQQAEQDRSKGGLQTSTRFWEIASSVTPKRPFGNATRCVSRQRSFPVTWSSPEFPESSVSGCCACSTCGKSRTCNSI